MHIWHLVLILPRTRRWTRYLHFTGEESAAPGFLTYTELKAVFSKPRAVSVGIRYEEVLLERRFPGLGWNISTNAHGKRKPIPLGLEYTAFWLLRFEIEGDTNTFYTF